MLDFRRIIRDSGPAEYGEIVETDEILTAAERLNEQIYLDTQSLLAQFFIETATWAIPIWEDIAGLYKSDIMQKTWEENGRLLVRDMEAQTWESLEGNFVERRSVILAKWRGSGTTTKAKIIEVAKSYTGGTVEVIEYPAECRVVVKFTDLYGVPAGLSELQKVINEIMPAHLLVEYAFKYQSFNELDSRGWTFDALDAETLTFDEFDQYGK